MTPVAIYARHSTDKQQHSTQDQIDRCKKYCAQQNYEVICTFYDEKISGSAIINRPGIRDLIDASLCRYFEKVVSEDLSRFSRDQGDIAYLFKKMRFLDIALHTVTEGEINELHIGLKGTMNALYLKDLGDKTYRGMIAAVLRGSVPGGRAYGYDTIHTLDGKGEVIRGIRHINETEANIVRYIFQQYSEGKILREICETLNFKGISSPKGGKWRSTTLIGQAARKTGLLRQSLYKGVVTFNRMAYRKHPDTGKRLSFLRPEKEWLKIPIPELAIFEEEYFEDVQKKIEARSSLRKQRKLLNDILDENERSAIAVKKEKERRSVQAKPRYKATYIVSGHMKCARHRIKITNSRVKLYSCPIKGCAHRNMRLERDLMPIVLKSLNQFDSSGLDAYFEGVEPARRRLHSETASLNQKIEKTQAEIQNVLDAIGKGRKSNESNDWLEKQSLKIRRLQYEISVATTKLQVLVPITDHEKSIILVKYNRAVKSISTAYSNRVFDQAATLKVSFWIDTFLITSYWDEIEKKRKRSVKTIYDWPRLLKSLRP